MAEQEKKPSYKATLNLPTTSFSIRAGAGDKEPALRAQWAEQGVEQQYFGSIGEQETFVLHDGPPYANGSIHMGTALNKVLKDMVVRSQRMMGKNVQYRPGWDCHGMPIEFKVAAEHGQLRHDDPAAFKKKCRAYAAQWQQVQEKEFKELGVFAQWDDKYLTMQPAYQGDILRSLATFVEKGHIERKGKTVPWCFTCQTVLANAEIEHEDRKDPSCYILFEAKDMQYHAGWKEKRNPSIPLHTAPPEFAETTLSLSFLIWTTTPWTIPLNRAVVLHPDAQYAIVKLDDTRAMIVGADLVEKLAATFDRELEVLTTVHSSELIGMQAHHPLVDDLLVPIISDDGVMTTDGTACLHSAPGCGPEDYLMGVKNGLEIYSPLAPDGTYTHEIMPSQLAGMPITDGQWWVLKQLKERGALVHKGSIRHSYPHCWRCHNGLMFRATDQWFCSLSRNDLVNRARGALDDMAFVPNWGKTRLDSFLSHRTEWCISRQRSWGMPIPALFNNQTGQAFIAADFINAIAEKVAIEGIEYWDTVTVAQLRTDGLLPKELVDLADEHISKETDILDVWFDSGVSHAAVIKARGGTLPVDMYLEGSDQHRGWFQSSFLSSMVLNDAPQTKTIVTHGFVVDEKGHKMSKSKGNVMYPQDIIKKYGADVLRLWVASVDYERDVPISQTALGQAAEVYRKIRNTCRFLLANLYDFDPETDLVPPSDMRLLDRRAISNAFALNKQVSAHYQNYSFSNVVQTLAHYCTVHLSAHYLDMSKDRLYVEVADGQARRSAQSAQYVILQVLNRLIAPILVYTADDVYASTPYVQQKPSVHLEHFVTTLYSTYVGSDTVWQALPKLREEILRCIEKQRETGVIKHSLEAAVTLHVSADSSYGKTLSALITQLGEQSLSSFFKEWLIVSQFKLADADTDLTATACDGVAVGVAHADGVKCPRCWHWTQGGQEDGLCTRCAGVLAY